MKTQNTVIKYLLPLYLMVMLGGCAVLPKDLDSQDQDDGQRFFRKVAAGVKNQTNRFPDATEVVGAEASSLFYQTRLVRGDVVRLAIRGMDHYDGLYQVGSDGGLDLPFAERFGVSHLSRADLITKIEAELVRLQWFYRESVNVELSLVQLAPINVSVAGAVFNPGRVTINSQPITKPDPTIAHTAGAFSERRDLTSALLAAGGLRPDADLVKIYIKRGDKTLQVPLTRLMDGAGFVHTPSLIDGDQIIVSSTGVIDSSLIRPTQITPPGMRVFMSNLTAPALNNAQSAVGADSTRLPYGSSLLDSVISANCVGGTHQANASRSVVLVTRNLGSNQQLVVRRSINQLLANSSDSSVNPFMMPNDGIACYDSRFTNFRDVARGIGELISPILLGRLL